MTRRISCTWCHDLNAVDDAAVTYCASCGHRADAPQEQCDCRKCADKARLLRIREKERDPGGESRRKGR